MEYSIELLKNPSVPDLKCIQSLLKELSGTDKHVPDNIVLNTVKDSNVIVARDDKKIVAMITISFYVSFNGVKGWIEDFIVSESYRGRGLSKLLLEKAVSIAREKQASSINLTSRPSRIEAHSLYKSRGFNIRETDVFILSF